MSKASEPDKQNGTLFADSIRASSLNRLHQKAGQKTAPDQRQRINLTLATREPSTEDINHDVWEVRFVPTSGHFSSGHLTRRWHPMTVKRAIAATA
jgi:hypothetical protein